MLLALLSPSVLSPPFPDAWPLLPPVLPVPMDGQHGRRGEQMQPLTRRSGKLMLLGLSTFARYHHLVAPKANAPQLQTCISLADPGQMSPDRGLKGQPVFQCLSLQACPYPHHTFCPHILRLCSPTCIVWCKFAIAATRSLLHRVITWCFSLQPPGPQCTRAGAQEFSKAEEQSPAPEERPPLAPAPAAIQQETSFADKALEVVAGILDCFRSSASRTKKLMLYLEHCVGFWSPQHKRAAHAGESPAKGQEDHQRMEASLLGG